MRTARLLGGIAILVAALLLGGCTNGVYVVNARADAIFRKMSTNVLNSADVSPRTMQILRQYDLEKTFRRNPVAALQKLDEECLKYPTRETVFALAELSYLTAQRSKMLDRRLALSLYLGTVEYSYYYLFDDEIYPPASPYDPQYRLTCDLYNRSLAQLIRMAQNQEIMLDKDLRLETVQGDIDLAVARFGFQWAKDDFNQFKFARDFEVKGLANRFDTYGMGVPLISIRDRKEDADPQERFLPHKQSFPVTAFLRMDGRLRDKNRSCRCATLELYDPLCQQSVVINGREVPLESDLSTPLAYFLSNAKLQKIELTSLLAGESLLSVSGLYMMQPYEPGKIPVVFVHGLWSSPMAWVQMFNDLRGDPVLRDRYQFWFFLYPTGNPFLYSASLLRKSLDDAIATFDPEGRDEAMKQMVLVGHSMGGLLSKLMIQRSDDQVWNLVSKVPFEKINASEEERARIRQVFFFEPQPRVKRVVFIATPHRGSRLSDNLVGRLGSYLIRLPKQLMEAQAKLLLANPDAFTPLFSGALPTSVDTLSPESPIIKTVASIPVDPQVKLHSIIGNVKKGDPAKGTDGVVPYSSSHLSGVESETIVPAGHACQTHPLTVLEVKRILRTHLAEVDTERPLRPAVHLGSFVEEWRKGQFGSHLGAPIDR